jgi:hypothetical protein
MSVLRGSPISAQKLTLIGAVSLILILLALDVIVFKFISHKIYTHSTSHQIKDADGEFVNYRRVFPKNENELKGTLFIFPPTGGENIIDRLYAADFALQGYEVFILQTWTGYEIEGFKYELHNKFYGSAQIALNKVLTKAKTTNFGILGTSVGALHTSVALTVNPKLKTGFIIVGGLPIPEVIIQSNQQAMVNLKNKRYVEYNLTDDTQYLKELNQVFQFEPTAQDINHSTGKTIGAIVSKNDELVPFENQIKASDFFKTSELTTSRLSHTTTVMYYGLFKRHKVIKFFKQNL